MWESARPTTLWNLLRKTTPSEPHAWRLSAIRSKLTIQKLRELKDILLSRVRQGSRVNCWPSKLFFAAIESAFQAAGSRHDARACSCESLRWATSWRGSVRFASEDNMRRPSRSLSPLKIEPGACGGRLAPLLTRLLGVEIVNRKNPAR